MECISKDELHIQYKNLENKPSMGFATLLSNVQFLQKRGIIVNEIAGSSSHSFVFRCSQRSSNGAVNLTIKCIMVNNYESLSNAIELYEQQCDVRGISEYLQCYDSFYYNKEDEVINFTRKGFYQNTIEQIYKSNSSRYGQRVLNRFDVVRSWIQQLLESVSMLHERGLPHGGIKASNIFIEESSNKIRLADFGFCQKFALMNYNQTQKDLYTTPIEGISTRSQKFNDIYALVILIYQMSFGFDSSYQQIQQLKNGVPLDETEQDENPYDYDENEFKYRVVRLSNQVICRTENGYDKTRRKISIFYIADVLSMSRNIQSFSNSPRYIDEAVNCGFTDKVLENGQVPMISQQEKRVLSQEELLAQELLYQQQKHQEEEKRIQKQIYQNENVSLQQKIDVYKKLDFEKYQKHSQQNSSSHTTPEKQIENQNIQQQQKYFESNEVFTSNQFMNLNQEEQQTDFSKKGVDLKYEQEKLQYLYQQQQFQSIDYIQMNQQMFQNKEINLNPVNINHYESNNLLKQFQPESQIGNQQSEQQVQQSYISLPSEVIKSSFDNQNKIENSTTNNIYSSSIIQENPKQQIQTQNPSQIQQQTIQKVDSTEDKYEDFWVLDLSHKNNVQKGNDDHPSYYKNLVQQIQYKQQMYNPHYDIYTEENLKCKTPTTIQQTLLKQIEEFDKYQKPQILQQNQIVKQKEENNIENLQEGNIQKQPMNNMNMTDNRQYQEEIRFSNGALQYLGQMQNGKKNGYGTLFSDQSNKIYEGYFKDDLFHGQGRELYENGMVLNEGNFSEGYLNGPGRSFYKNGNICYEGEYLNGSCHGMGTKFDEEQNMISTGQFINGKMNGIHKKFYQNGQVQQEINFKNNRRDGQALTYFPNGNTCSSIIYKNGKKTSGVEYDEFGQKTFEGKYEQEES